MKKYFLLIITVLTLFLIACAPLNNPSSKEKCESKEGKFISGFNECEGLTQVTCSDIGGIFDECASSCRNNPDAQFCTSECVPVCTV